MIPKKIHYCWFGNNKLPVNVKKCIESWEKYCPDYEIIMWNETNFDVNCNKFIKKAYDAKVWAFVSDYARLKIIYEEGGIYLDTDVELIKNLDSLLNNSCYVGVQERGKLIATGLGFGAEKGNYMVGEMLKEYDNLDFDIAKINELACPLLNTKAFEKNGFVWSNKVSIVKDATIYTPTYFDPYPSGENVILMSKETISIHHYSASWTGRLQKLKRKLAILIGEKRVICIKKLICKRKMRNKND